MIAPSPYDKAAILQVFPSTTVTVSGTSKNCITFDYCPHAPFYLHLTGSSSLPRSISVNVCTSPTYVVPFYLPVVSSFAASSADINNGWDHEGPAILGPVTATEAVAGGSCLHNSFLTVLLIVSSMVARAFMPAIGPAVGTFLLAVPAMRPWSLWRWLYLNHLT